MPTLPQYKKHYTRHNTRTLFDTSEFGSLGIWICISGASPYAEYYYKEQVPGYFEHHHFQHLQSIIITIREGYAE